MAKLNSTERKAVAWKIQEDLTSYANKVNKERREKAKKEFYKTPIGKAVKKVEDMAEEMEVRWSPINQSFKNELMDYVHISIPSTSSLENQLILEQIDSQNIEEIINKITEKYKTQ